MTLYSPTPSLNDSDKRLLFLLAKLLLEHIDSSENRSNLPLGAVALTDREAAELLRLLDSLLNSRDFLEASHFVEGMASYGSRPDRNLRELYLSARKRRGRSRALASINWSDFLVRLGLRAETRLGKATERMSQEYFQNMERRLFTDLYLHPRVIEIVMRILRMNSSHVEQIRNGNRPLPRGAIRNLIADPYFRWRASETNPDSLHLSTNRIASAIIIVADISVLFTTRDWSVAGTLSAISGSISKVALD